MSRNHRCQVCRHDERWRIELLRAGGASLDSLADKFKVHRDSTRRVLFAFAAKEIRDFAQYVWNLNAAIAATADSAQRSSIGGQQFQGLSTAAAFKGVNGDTFNAAMVAFNQQVDLAKNGLGDLRALLTLNGKTVSDTATTFGMVADLVKNAASEAQKFSILQAAGLPATREFAKLMEQGGESIKKQGDAATKLTNQQLEDAKRIDEAWQQGWTNFENFGKRAVVSTFSSISEIWSRGFGPTGRGAMELSGQPLIPGSQGLKTSPTSAPDPTKSLAQQREINAQMQPRLGLLGPLATVQSEQKPKPETEKPDDGNKLRRAA